jgi:hypothetical protein
MARSDYVYAVMHADIDPPLATFTVKRELRGMLTRLNAEAPSTLTSLRVFRMLDGPGGCRAEMVIQDIIDGK